MSTLFGILHKNGSPVQKTALEAVAQQIHYWQPDDQTLYADKNMGMGVLFLQTSSKQSINESFYQKGKLSVVADARIDNKENLIQKLGLRKKSYPAALLLLEAYLKWGVSFPEHLLGDFAFALYDQEENRLLLGRDHVGIKPLYYFNNENHCVFGSCLKSVKAFQKGSHTLSEQHIAEMLVHQLGDKHETCYKDIFHLPPAHTLTVQATRTQLKQYWDLNPQRMLCFPNEADYIEGFKEKLQTAIQRRVQQVDALGCELSGGIDSSTVFSYAHEINPKITAFSHVMDDDDLGEIFPFKDERYYIESLLKFRNSNHSVYVTGKQDNIMETLRKYANIYDGYTQQAFHLLSDVLYKSASNQGVRVLLSGFGGDELVSSKAHGYLTELTTTRQWGKLYEHLQNRYTPARAKTHFLIKAVKSMVPFDRMKDELALRLSAEYNLYAPNKAFAKRMNLYQLFIEKRRYVSDPVLSQKQYNQITHPHVAHRLAHCAIAAQAQRVEYRYPLLDVELMEYYLALPPEIKQKEGMIRYPIRMAMEGYVPKEIQWRKEKHFQTIPTFFTRYLPYQQAIENLIAQGKHSAASEYIDIEKLLQWNQRIPKEIGKTKGTMRGFYNYLWLLQYLSDEQG